MVILGDLLVIRRHRCLCVKRNQPTFTHHKKKEKKRQMVYNDAKMFISAKYVFIIQNKDDFDTSTVDGALVR